MGCFVPGPLAPFFAAVWDGVRGANTHEAHRRVVSHLERSKCTTMTSKVRSTFWPRTGPDAGVVPMLVNHSVNPNELSSQYTSTQTVVHRRNMAYCACNSAIHELIAGALVGNWVFCPPRFRVSSPVAGASSGACKKLETRNDRARFSDPILAAVGPRIILISNSPNLLFTCRDGQLPTEFP